MGDPLPIEGDITPHHVGVSDHPAGASDTRRLLGEVRETAKSKAQHYAQQASQEVQGRVDSYVHSTAGQVRSLGNAFREASARTNGEQPQPIASGANLLAGKLDDIASYLDRKDARRLSEDLQSLVRSNPTLVLGGLLTAGFIAGRFLRVGNSQQSAQTGS